MKSKLLVVGVAVCMFVLAGCTTAQSDTIQLRMAHGAPEGSETGMTIDDITELTLAETSGEVEIDIFGSGVLGSERDTIELVQAGVLDMAKVGGSSLESFASIYGVLALPFLFDGEEHLYAAMTCTDLVDQLNDVTRDSGFVMVGWYPSGARNFYTANGTAILKPEDMKGLKFRVMESATASEMVSLLGGSPVPMAGSETYTALQQGVIDGAENNEVVLTANSHKDVATDYSYTEHQIVPDIFIMSTDVYDTLSDEEIAGIQESLWKNNNDYRAVNNKLLADSREEAETAGVKFHDDLDKAPFKEAVQPQHEEFMSRGEEYKKIYDTIANSGSEECAYEPENQ